MCTVSYIPTNSGFILTSNRDENPNRKTKSPQRFKIKSGEEIIAPIDEENNGTWIATSDKKRIACLLNGAFIKHERVLPYRKSRGLIVLEAFEYASFSEFVKQIDLNNIEPFTLILAEKDFLQVLIWDGEKKHHETPDVKEMHLWSSSTLYSRDQHMMKLDFFTNFIKDKVLDENTILEVHGLTKDNSFILDRPLVKTVSITQAVIDDLNEVSLNYNLKREKVSI